jgi:DNA-directed RNA polymerase specialized sigma24 family protein
MYLDEIQRLTTERLACLCREQNKAFKEDRSNCDGRYCYELIRRAVFGIDEAGTMVYEIYRPWLQRKIATLGYRSQDELEDLCQEAFIRFFRYVTPETWSRFSDLAQLLSYMRKCCESSVVTHQRARSKQKKLECAFPEGNQLVGASSNNLERPAEQQAAQEELYQQLWDCVRRNCNDADDYFLALQLWAYDLEPREVARRFSDRFPTIVDVYKRKRNLIDRMKRDGQCEELWQRKVTL